MIISLSYRLYDRNLYKKDILDIFLYRIYIYARSIYMDIDMLSLREKL